VPYGVSKAHGGDTPANDKRMERCVADVKAQGHSESSAIAICKASLFPSKAEKRRRSARN
jgi:hypothetical protein